MGRMTHRRARWMVLVGVSAVGLLAVAAPLVMAEPERPSLAGDEDASELGGISPAVAEQAIADLAASAPPPQQVALSDGSVDLAEYQAASSRALSCVERRLSALIEAAPTPTLREIDVVIDGPDLSMDQFAYFYTYTFTGDIPEAILQQYSIVLGEQVTEADRGCQDRLLDESQAAYQIELLSDASYVEEVSNSFEDCVAESGLDVPPDRGITAFDLAGEVATEVDGLLAASATDAAPVPAPERRAMECFEEHESLNSPVSPEL